MNINFLIKRMSEFVIVIIIGFIIVQATTFGLRFGRKSFVISSRHSPLAERLKKHVSVLATDIGDRNIFSYQNLNKAAEYIAGELTSFGYQVDFQEYTAQGKSFRNIIAVRKGTSKSRETILVGAHYDTCLNVGADDNASGVAALLELARYFSQTAVDRDVKFVAFVNEEPPFYETELAGNTVYAKAARAAGEDIKAALIFEMVGYFSERRFSQRYPPLLGPFFPNKGDFIVVVGNFPSFVLVRKISSIFGRETGFPVVAAVMPSWVPGVTFSDHYAFWQQGYSAVMFTDTAFYRNPNYHKNSDTAETLNYAYMAEFVEGMKLVVQKLAQ